VVQDAMDALRLSGGWEPPLDDDPTALTAALAERRGMLVAKETQMQQTAVALQLLVWHQPSG
jgi:hypothetical protein